MKKLSYIISIIIGLAFLFSCEQENILFTEDMASVGFYKEKANLLEVDKSGKGKDSLTVQILVTALNNAPSITVSFDIDDTWYKEIDGAYYKITEIDTIQVNPAFEGEDFVLVSEKSITIAEGSGYAPVTVAAIDNDKYDPLGNKTFKLKITDNSLGYKLSSEWIVTITIIDDDHPLGWMLGEYSAKPTATANGSDEFPITLSAIEGETDKIKIYGLSGLAFGAPATDPYFILASVNDDNTNLTIKTGQEWKSWDWGPTIFSAWDDAAGEGVEVKELTGIISNVDGLVKITFNQAHSFIITDGNNKGLGLQWAYNEDDGPNGVTAVWTLK